VTGIGETLQNIVRIVERRRHKGRRFAAGVTKHDALIACAFVLVPAASTPWQYRRLRMKADADVRIFQ